MLVIVDYGMGNAASIMNMIRRVNTQTTLPVCISSNPSDIEKAAAVILPGVGAFDHAMERLHALKLADVLVQRVRDDAVPFMGICLGMHVLFQSSEEGARSGLGLLPGTVRRFAGDAFSSNQLKIPHMGWNQVTLAGPQPMFSGLEGDARFYFVHTYHVVCDAAEHVAATCEYGYEFACAVHHKNIFAVQFHPEKSHRFGMAVFNNFIGSLC